MRVHMNQAIVGAGGKHEVVDVDDAYGARLVANGYADPVDDGPEVVDESAEESTPVEVDIPADTDDTNSDPETDETPETVDPEPVVKRTPRKTTT